MRKPALYLSQLLRGATPSVGDRIFQYFSGLILALAIAIGLSQFAIAQPTNEKIEGVILGDDFNIVRVLLDKPLDEKLRALGLKAHLHEQIIEASKARNGGELPDQSNEYLAVVVKNSQVWGIEFGPVGQPYRIHTAVLDGETGFFTWTGKAIQSVDTMKRWPIRFSRVTSEYNLNRKHPMTGRVRPHLGIDLKARSGTKIYAPAAGRVLRVGGQSGYGRTIELQHEKGYRTLYAHMSDYVDSLDRGDWVEKGEHIGYVGNSGLSSGSHLHYEVTINGKNYNPRTVKLLNEKPQLRGKRLAEFDQDKRQQKAALAEARKGLGIN